MSNPQSLGVIVGRFQVPELHAGHIYLIDMAMQQCDRILIILTSTGGMPTDINPLDFKTRSLMIKGQFPNVVIRELTDMDSDEKWSAALDTLITEVAEGKPATIFASTMSYIEHYRGRFESKRIPEIPCVSGTRSRQGAKDVCLNDKKFRQGVMHSVLNRFPISYQTIDLIIYKPETDEILLGQKPIETEWRFIGGFVDATDESLEIAVIREGHEETGGVEIQDPKYLGSCRVNNRRYRGSTDGIMTAIFTATYVFGSPTATDDLSDIKWVKATNVEELLVPEHKILWAKAKSHFIKQ